jgi:histidinol phosphatase-like PHP family hydrolase
MEKVAIARTLNEYADLLGIQGENPSLVTLDDIRGDFQMHSTWSDGSHTIAEMARACHGRGYEYCAITDHSKVTRIAGWLDTPAFTKQWDEIARVRQRLDGYMVLLRFMQYGIDQVRRGWLEREHVLNAMSWAQLQQWLKHRRS